ncbi:MAG: hypothetical protein ACKVTZ_16905 [Bacteroidia bacterium]
MKKGIMYFLILLLCLKLGYAYWQYLQMPLDGDISSLVMAKRGYQAIIEDPLALQVLFHDAHYPNPNRFFAHALCMTYFRNVPFLLQKVMNPIESLYTASALAKGLIHLLMLSTLVLYVTKSFTFKKNYLLAAVLLIPLFQVTGYNAFFCIIDPSISYNFFYALPNALFCIFFLFFYVKILQNQEIHFSLTQHFCLILLAVPMILSGPLPAAISLLAFPLLWLHRLRTQGLTQISFSLWAYTFAITALSLYSLFIGRNNAEAFVYELSLLQRYQNVPQGLFYLLFTKIGYPLFLISIGINIWLLRPYAQRTEIQRLFSFFKGFGVFTFLYIVLLPIGGYRAYRPDIIRGDVMMPIFLGLMIMWGTTAYYLLHELSAKKRQYYLVFCSIFCAILFLADEPVKPEQSNLCEKEALYQLSNAQEKEVFIEKDCKILAWVRDFNAIDAGFNADFFYFLGITKERKEYCQERK